MNKKILLGFVAAGTAGAFWACGDGDINEFLMDDEVVMTAVRGNPQEVDNYVERAVKTACQDAADPTTCKASLTPGASVGTEDSTSIVATSSSATPGFNNKTSSGSNNTPDTGSSPGTSLSIVTGTSSSSNPTGGPQGGTSQGPQAGASSSSVKIQQGSTVTWGTCAPTVSAVEKGKTVDWKFTTNNTEFNPQLAMNSTFDWTFAGGNPGTKSVVGIDGINVKGITYAASGTYAPSVNITQKDGKTGSVTCSPVEVTGAAVTGCKCTPTVTQVDIAVNAEAGWNVTGCVSADGATTFTYAWSEPFSALNTASIAASVGAKGEYTPTVKVKNADNGLMEVTCGTVKAIDSNHPDFGFTKKDQEIEIPKGESTIILDLPVGWNGGNSKCVLRCSDADANITITANGKSSMPSYSTTLDLDVSQTTGKTALLINLDFTSAKTTAKCKVSGG